MTLRAVSHSASLSGHKTPEEISLVRLLRAVQLSGQGLEVPAAATFMDEAEEPEGPNETLALPGSSIDLGTPSVHGAPHTRRSDVTEGPPLLLGYPRQDVATQLAIAQAEYRLGHGHT